MGSTGGLPVVCGGPPETHSPTNTPAMCEARALPRQQHRASRPLQQVSGLCSRYCEPQSHQGMLSNASLPQVRCVKGGQ